jgi:rhodanese-related sulfurtransferase
MKYRIVLVAVTVAAAWLHASVSSALDHTKDSLDTVKQNLAEKKAVLVDVREQKEWDRGHLQHATLVPLSRLTRTASDPAAADKLAKDLPKDRIVYCHCARGVRAQMAGDILQKLGFDVRPLAAGFEQLLEAGFSAAVK